MEEPQTEITSEDLWYILNNPWSISEAEWRLRDENSRKSMFSYIQELLKLTKEEGYSNIWRTTDKEPVAILGSYKVSDKNYTTFFICSHHYEANAMKVSFEMRKTLREKSQMHKGCTIGIYSVSQHPHLFTWLRFLGFTYQPEENNGDSRYFEFLTATT